MIPDEDGDVVYPSAVFFPQNGDNPWIGTKAARRAQHYPETTVYDSKRMLCKKIDDENIQKLIPNWPFELDSTPNGEIQYKIGEVERYSPEDISQFILEHIRRSSNAFGHNNKLNTVRLENCIITVPAYFDDAQINATKKAALKAGFRCNETLREPVAAALSLGL